MCPRPASLAALPAESRDQRYDAVITIGATSTQQQPGQQTDGPLVLTTPGLSTETLYFASAIIQAFFCM